MSLATVRYLASIAVAISLLAAPSLAVSSPATEQGAALFETEREITTAMERWLAAVAGRQTENLAQLVDTESEDYYLYLRDLALNADAHALSPLIEVDQLQVMFLRLMLEPEQLRSMNVQQLLAFAIGNGFIGMELRHADRLDKVQVSGDTATGRLMKFGRADRPDRYLQYFVKEQGAWLVSLRGERDRLEGEFDGFVQRTGLSRSEAAFLILETRVMRKVTATDFFLPVAPRSALVKSRNDNLESMNTTGELRLVSVRLSETLVGLPAATIDDTETGLKHVVARGESIPGNPEFVLSRISSDKAIFRNTKRPAESLILSLDATDQLSRRAGVARTASDSTTTIFDEASLGEKYPGQMMMQWRNIGLRGRPQLLQQAWLTPDFGGAVGPDKSMLGLRVRQVGEASFWDQIGLQDGDLLTEINGLRVNTLDAWKKAIRIAETYQDIKVRLQRGDHELIFRTLTVRPG